jgi:dTDP-4-dehydrorhamnose reductase
MLRLARERPSLSIVSDQVGCPTWARNLARVSARLIEAVRANAAVLREQAIWHYCDSGVVSWYDFAQAIFATALDAGLLERLPQVTAVPSAAFPQEAERPRYSVLDTTAIRRSFGIEPAGLEASLKACLEELKTHEGNA